MCQIVPSCCCSVAQVIEDLTHQLKNQRPKLMPTCLCNVLMGSRRGRVQTSAKLRSAWGLHCPSLTVWTSWCSLCLPAPNHAHSQFCGKLRHLLNSRGVIWDGKCWSIAALTFGKAMFPPSQDVASKVLRALGNSFVSRAAWPH